MHTIQSFANSLTESVKSFVGVLHFGKLANPVHPTYSRNIMCQKWECDCGLWVLNEIIKNKYAESLKKIMGAVWEMSAK